MMVNGLDCLREEIVKRGCTKQQAESKVVSVVLDILAKTPFMEYQSLEEARDELRSLQKRIVQEQANLRVNQQMVKNERESLKRLAEQLEAAHANKRELLRDAFADQIEYEDKLLKALNEGETPEARDTLRKAQMFVNSVNVDTKYDNTAYIIGLASILNSGASAPIDELKTINPDLFKGKLRDYDAKKSNGPHFWR